MPAIVKSSVLSTGITLADGTSVWPRATKKSMNARRSSSAVVGRSDIPLRLPAGRAVEARLQLAFTRPHCGFPLRDGRPDVVAPALDHVGRREPLRDPAQTAGDRPRRAEPEREPDREPEQALEHQDAFDCPVDPRLRRRRVDGAGVSPLRSFCAARDTPVPRAM